MLEEKSRSQPQDFRLGVWAVVQSPGHPVCTIHPDEKCGAFLVNLIRGMLGRADCPRIVLVVLPEAIPLYRGWLGDDPRVEFVSPPAPGQPRPAGTLAKWTDRINKASEWLGRVKDTCIQQPKSVIKRTMAALAQRAKRFHPLSLLILLVPGLPLFLLAWLAYALLQIGSSVFQIVTAPVRWGLMAIRRLAKPSAQEPVPEPDWNGLAQAANGDAWFAPSIWCNFPSGLPGTVFLVDDLATRHFPDSFPRLYTEQATRTVSHRMARATLVACLSATARDQDLCGLPGLQPDRVRVIRPAIPRDSWEVSPACTRQGLPFYLRKPFLIYPAAFQAHNNHEKLIRALQILRDEHGLDDLHLVFTGEPVPPHEINRLTHALELEYCVHYLGKVPRKELASLYQCALATIVPSQYDHGAFQIAESLYLKTPVACSDIPEFREQCASMGEAMLYFDPEDAGSIVSAILQIQADPTGVQRRQHRAAQSWLDRTWSQAAGEWLDVFWEAHQIASQPVPTATLLPVSSPTRRPRVALFLGYPYQGGVWEAVQTLMSGLVEVNRRRKELDLVLLVHKNQKDLEKVAAMSAELRLGRMELHEIPASEAMFLQTSGWMSSDQPTAPTYLWPYDSAEEFLAADAWFSLLDRFSHPLLPVRPFGVWVYDMIQHHLPHYFPAGFTSMYHAGMLPTLHAVDVVVTSSPSTREDAAHAYRLVPDQQRLIPLACSPDDRFRGLQPETVPQVRSPFLLYAANAAPHKGARVVLKGYARLKARLKERTPMLVQCGVLSEHFSRHNTSPLRDPYWDEIRQLVVDLELVEGKDVVFLGFVNDAQLLDLYQRCRVVINAAAFDNGSYNLIEGHYFGRPLVSSDYPAVRDLTERFNLPVRFFPLDDATGLCRAVEQACEEPILVGDQLAAVRERLTDPEYSYRRQAERVYEILLELGNRGMQQRSREPSQQQVRVVPPRLAVAG